MHFVTKEGLLDLLDAIQCIGGQLLLFSSFFLQNCLLLYPQLRKLSKTRFKLSMFKFVSCFNL